MPASSRFKSPKAAAEYLDCSASYLEKLRTKGGGPPFHRLQGVGSLGGRKIVYDVAALDEWVQSRRFATTTEYPAPVGQAA